MVLLLAMVRARARAGIRRRRRQERREGSRGRGRRGYPGARASLSEFCAEGLSAGVEGRAGPEGVERLRRCEERLCEFERVQKIPIALPERKAPYNK